MKREINKLPLLKSLFENPVKAEISCEAWDLVAVLLFEKPWLRVSPALRGFYAFGYYAAQVNNGGHGQLLFNIDIGEHRSSWLSESAILGAKLIGAKGFEAIARDFSRLIDMKPTDDTAEEDHDVWWEEQADALHALNERFDEIMFDQKAQLILLHRSSRNDAEKNFLRHCIEHIGDWKDHISALELSWVFRSDLFFAVADDEYDEVWTLLTEKP